MDCASKRPQATTARGWLLLVVVGQRIDQSTYGGHDGNRSL